MSIQKEKGAGDSETEEYFLQHCINTVHALKPLVLEELPSANEAPRGRSGHRIVCTNENLYVFGGYNPRFHNDIEAMLHELCVFNFATRKWRKLECRNFPLEVASSAVALVGQHLLVIGGTHFPFANNLSNQLRVCNLGTEEGIYTFETMPAVGTLPEALYGHCIIYHKDYLYTIGGTTGFHYFMDIKRYDLLNKRWEDVYILNDEEEEEPKPRYRHECVEYMDKIYVLGGGWEEEFTYGFKKLPVFDLNMNTWSSVVTHGDLSCKLESGPYPHSRKAHGCAQDPKNRAVVYIIGGIAQERMRDTWRIDLSTLQWKHMESLSLPVPTNFHSAAVAPNGRLVVYGGVYTNNSMHHVRSDKIYQAWIMTPPTLETMCWEAIAHNLREKSMLKKDAIRKLRLPRKMFESILD